MDYNDDDYIGYNYDNRPIEECKEILRKVMLSIKKDKKEIQELEASIIEQSKQAEVLKKRIASK